MEAKAKLFGHSIHHMLIVFPLGLLGMGVVFDIVFMSTHNQCAKAVGAAHGIGNVVVVLLFLGSVLLRRDDMAVPPNVACVCSFCGLLLAL